ncbi:outer membrane lipoprotein carrier protein LolA [Microbulbifer echini]|uniref:Outer membrane lipoprotein carrier protein LolA n=1 Tax=Microbulbifer echini TaxID=1529067 RepID=A0ABV4NKA4_9GAMM|nr:hypothetical protein [uncultured Microbulbifer sp.]
MQAVYRLIISIIAFLSSTVAFPLTSEQQKVIEEIEKDVISSPQMLGTFSQKKTLSQLPRPLVSSGVLAISESLGLSWRIESPIESHRIFKIDNSESEHRSSNGIIENLIADSLLQIINGDFSKLGRTYILSPYFEQEQWRIKLTPKQNSFRRIIESIEIAGDQKIRKIILSEANMSLTEIDIVDLQPVNPDNRQLLNEFAEDKQK